MWVRDARKDITGMCRTGGRRCRGASTRKAAAAQRARSYRARRKAAAADPNTPATSEQAGSDQETTVPNERNKPEKPAGQRPAEGDVTRTSKPRVQPNKTAKPKQPKKPIKPPTMAAIERHLNEALAAASGAPTKKERAAYMAEATAAQEREEARVAQTRADIAQERRERQRAAEQAESRRERPTGPVDVVGDGNITITGGGDASRTKRSTNPRPGRRPGHVVEDHTEDTPVSDEDRVWTVSPSPVPTSTHRRGGRDTDTGHVDTSRSTAESITQDDAGNLTVAGAQGPVYITTSGPDGKPTAVGSAESITQDDAGNLTVAGAQGPVYITTSGPDGKPAVAGNATPITRVTSDQPQQQTTTSRAPRQRSGHGDVTGRRRADKTRREARGGRGDGTVNVVGDRNITVTNPGSATVWVGNHAGPGANVGLQATGDVANVTIHTGTGDVTGDTRAQDIARNIADRVHRAVADMADAIGDAAHDDDTSPNTGIQARHIRNSRVIRDR